MPTPSRRRSGASAATTTTTTSAPTATPTSPSSVPSTSTPWRHLGRHAGGHVAAGQPRAPRPGDDPPRQPDGNNLTQLLNEVAAKVTQTGTFSGRSTTTSAVAHHPRAHLGDPTMRGPAHARARGHVPEQLPDITRIRPKPPAAVGSSGRVVRTLLAALRWARAEWGPAGSPPAGCSRRIEREFAARFGCRGRGGGGGGRPGGVPPPKRARVKRCSLRRLGWGRGGRSPAAGVRSFVAQVGPLQPRRPMQSLQW